MRRNSTLHVCLKALVAALVLCSGTTPGDARQRQAGNPGQMEDVIVYVAAGPVSSAVDFAARATAGWIYAKAGVRLVWRDGNAPAGRGRYGDPDGPLQQSRFG